MFSQLMNLQQAMSNWVNQGGVATWASVEKPFIMAVGGNGALHAIDQFNGLLGLDNAESRMTMRTNAQQWLRSAGREIGVELRRGGGGSAAPTKAGAYVREMQFAAYANDRLGFLDAYRNAIEAERDAGKDEPEKAVLQSWEGRNPLDVFRTKPDQSQLAQMYSVMSDNGREAVQDAIRLFDEYTGMIKPSQFESRMNAQIKGMTRIGGITPEQIRRQMASMALSQ
jgi:hypothetical protein